jgi:hypothetical protein
MVMNTNEDMFEQKINNLDTPHIDTPQHGQLLRASLLASANKKVHSNVFFKFRNYFLQLNNVIDVVMNKNKKFVLAGGLMALVAIVGVGFGNLTVGTVPHAEASELVGKSLVVANTIPAERRVQIEQAIEVDMVAILNEAYAAPDLKILSEGEVIKFTKAEKVAVTVSDDGFDHSGLATLSSSEGTVGEFDAMDIQKSDDGLELTMVKAVKFMSYTNPKGNETIIGLADDNTLVFKSIDSREVVTE